MNHSANSLDGLLAGVDESLSAVLARQIEAAATGLPAGISLVVTDGRLVGTITDGDVRRALVERGSMEISAGEVMNPDPITFLDTLSYREVLELLPDELARRGRRSRRFLGKVVLVDADHQPTKVLDYHQLWEQRVATHRHVVVVGLGYVGLTLALVMAEEGFQVTGVDLNREVVGQLRNGSAHFHEVGLAELLREQLTRGFVPTDSLPDDGEVFIVSVGTPVDHDQGKKPSLRALESSLRSVGEVLRPGALVVLRSTVPIGTTRDVALPILEAASGLRGGTDFHLSFAPERTTEGEALTELRTLPQLIAGLNDDSVEATAALFRELTPTIVRMESLEAAELAKLVNNSFRDLIFAFSNEVAHLAGRWGFDVVEAIAAANRGYPRDPVPLPSPGVGGPCLTKDPYILAAALEETSTLFAHGREVNERMHEVVVDRILAALERTGRDPSTATVLLAGLAFKGRPETDDLRDSSPVAIAHALTGRVGRLLGHDPVVSKAALESIGLEAVELPPETPDIDAICFLNNHAAYERLDIFEVVRGMAPNPVVFDGWHLLRPDDVVQAAPALYIGLSGERSSLP